MGCTPQAAQPRATTRKPPLTLGVVVMASGKRPNPPSVVELDGAFTHRMLHTRGIRLHAADAGQERDPLIVLIHGAFGGWFDFKDTIAPLANHGFHVAAVDLRGFGMSDKPASRAGSTLRIQSGDIAHVIRALGHTSAALVGADTGAIIARSVQQHYPDLVTATIELPTSRGISAAALRLPAPITRLSDRALDAAWRANLQADTTAAFHTTERFEEFLTLRLAARRIDHALPNIVAVSRLRPRLRPVGAPWDGSRLPHVEDPKGFARRVATQLLPN